MRMCDAGCRPRLAAGQNLLPFACSRQRFVLTSSSSRSSCSQVGSAGHTGVTCVCFLQRAHAADIDPMPITAMALTYIYVPVRGVGVLGAIDPPKTQFSSQLPHVASPPRFGDFPTKIRETDADDIRLRGRTRSNGPPGLPRCRWFYRLASLQQTTAHFVQRSTWLTRFVRYSGTMLIYPLHRGGLSSVHPGRALHEKFR